MLYSSGMSEIIFTIEESPEGGYEARALGFGIFTEADDIDTLHSNIKDAVNCHFEDAEKPMLIRLHFARQEIIAA